MIRIPLNNRTTNLANVLDKVIADHRLLREQNNPGRMVGKPNENPKLSEVDLIALRRKTKDVVIATDVFAYYIEKFDEKEVKAAATALFPKNQLISISGRFYYPGKYKDKSSGKEYMGYMGFHTNSNALGYRVYASWAAEPKKSFFRYWQNSKLFTEWEEKGWNFRAFEVNKSKLYWHCVYTECDRYSFGFRYA